MYMARRKGGGGTQSVGVVLTCQLEMLAMIKGGGSQMIPILRFSQFVASPVPSLSVINYLFLVGNSVFLYLPVQ